MRIYKYIYVYVYVCICIWPFSNSEKTLLDLLYMIRGFILETLFRCSKIVKGFTWICFMSINGYGLYLIHTFLKLQVKKWRKTSSHFLIVRILELFLTIICRILEICYIRNPIVGLQRLLALCGFVVALLNKKIKITFQCIPTNSPQRWVWYLKGLRYCIVWYKWRSVKIQHRIRASTIVRLKTEKKKIDLKYFFKRMRIAII